MRPNDGLIETSQRSMLLASSLRQRGLSTGFQRPGASYVARANELLEVFSHWFFWGEPPTHDGVVDLFTLE